MTKKLSLSLLPALALSVAAQTAQAADVPASGWSLVLNKIPKNINLLRIPN